MPENKDLLIAKENLPGNTCVICKDDLVLTTGFRGVKPLVHWLRQGNVPRGFSAADRVVGRATAYLYVLLGARAVHAQVMSRPALQVLEAAGILATWDALTDHIENRTKTGICPFEEAVQSISSPTLAYQTILEKLKELQKQG